MESRTATELRRQCEKKPVFLILAELSMTKHELQKDQDLCKLGDFEYEAKIH